MRAIMSPARLVGAAAIAAVLAASPAGARDDPQPDAERLMKNDAWCPIVLNHHLPAVTNAFVELLRNELSKRRDPAMHAAIAPLLETLLSVGRMDKRDPVGQAHLAMACTLGLPVVRKMISHELR